MVLVFNFSSHKKKSRMAQLKNLFVCLIQHPLNSHQPLIKHRFTLGPITQLKGIELMVAGMAQANGFAVISLDSSALAMLC